LKTNILKPGIREVVDIILSKSKNSKKPFVVGLSGNGASGKTVFCLEMKKYFDFSHVKLDGYYYDSKKRHSKNITGCHPDSFDKEKAVKDINKLEAGKDVVIPLDDGGFETIKHSNIIIIDGLSAFLFPNWKKMYDFSIFIDAPDELVWKRKLALEKERRNTDINEFKRLFELRMKQYCEYVRPQREFVDLIVKVKIEN